jgi:hypothetical protein
MATYEELFDLQRNQQLLDKITVAIIVSTNTIFEGGDAGAPWDGANHANRVIWAREAAINPRRMAEVFMANVLALNKAMTEAQIIGASDAAIQSNIDASVDSFADGTAVIS